MASSTREAPQVNSTRPSTVIRQTPILAGGAQDQSWLALLPSMLVSVGVHIVFGVAFVVIILFDGHSANGNDVGNNPVETNVDRPEIERDLTNADEGTNPLLPKGNDSPRLERMTFTSKDTDPTKQAGDEGTKGPGEIPIGPPLPLNPKNVGDLKGPDPGDALPENYTPGGFDGRKSAATRILAAGKNGGNSRPEDLAVARALEWLAAHQSKDGSWSLDHFEENGVDNDGTKVNCQCGDPGSIHNNIAGTAFGLLPYLGAALTPAGKGREVHNYSKVVENGLNYLLKNQQSDGAFVEPRSRARDQQSFMYAHGLAAIVLCEATSLVPEETKYQEAAQKAILFIVRAQHQAGGWRYHPGEAGDLSVTAWQVMALRSGQLAGLQVPKSSLDNAMHFLDSIQYSDGGGYGYYTKPGTDKEVHDDPTMTAAGLLCREYLGWGPNQEGLLKGAARLGQVPPNANEALNLYYYYYATQVLHHLRGDAWMDWNKRMRDLLVSRQDKGSKTVGNGHSQRGSWSPIGDRWGMAGGRLMETSLATLTLEVEYRYLPLYKQGLGGK